MKCFLIIFSFFLFSCSEVKPSEPVTAKWEFVTINEGKTKAVDAKLLNKINKKDGANTLEFKNDLSFSSVGSKNNSKGSYTLKNGILTMQYSDLPEPIKFNYSVVENKYLLLNNTEGKQLTWIYKKI